MQQTSEKQATTTINIKIGDLFKAVELYDKHKFELDKEHYQSPQLQILDENNDLVDIEGLMLKEDVIFKVTFDNGIELKAGSLHKLIYNKFDWMYVKDLQIGQEVILSDDSIVRVSEVIKQDKDFVYDVMINSDTHLYQTANKLIHHNTHHVEEILTAQLGDRGARWEIFSAGTFTASKFYETCYQHASQPHDKGFILVFDDVLDSFMTSEAGRNLLKGALQTKLSMRKMTWGSQGTSTPTTFQFLGKMIVISNKFPEFLFRGDTALESRFTKIIFNVSDEAVLEYIEKILNKVNPEIDGEEIELSMADKKMIFDWYVSRYKYFESAKSAGGISIRSLTLCMQYFVLANGDPKWKDKSQRSA